MSLYKNIIVAIDPFAICEEILEKANNLMVSGGRIEIIYVMELLVPLPSAPYCPPMLDLNSIHNKTKEAALEILTKVAEDYGITSDCIHLPIGGAAKEIRKLAEKNNADAIVMGSHGRHGIDLILGSTASAVIHGAPCDILVVKILDE